MVVVSHLFLFLGNKFRGRCDSCESHLPLIKTIYFPTAPLFIPSFIEPDIYGDVPYDIAFFRLDIIMVRDIGEKWVFFLELHSDSVPACLVGVFDGVIQGLAGGFAALQVREPGRVAAVFFFAENRRVYEFHDCSLLYSLIELSRLIQYSIYRHREIRKGNIKRQGTVTSTESPVSRISNISICLVWSSSRMREASASDRSPYAMSRAREDLPWRSVRSVQI